MKYFFCIWLLIEAGSAFCQNTYFPIDTLDVDSIWLEEINLRVFNIYQFKTTISSDSIFLVLPQGLPRGYFEAYYDNDTNKLALAFYSYGKSAYSQQFYKNGAMKSDTEYSSAGKMHGLHVLYSRTGEEVWHAEYYLGELDKRYRLDYLEVENSTKAALASKVAFGQYEFWPTPSRARKEQINLLEDGTFLFADSDRTCDFCQTKKGTWKQDGDFLTLTLNQKNYWRTNTRRFAITATVRLTQLELLEVKPWGVDWYHSNYKKTN